MAKIKPRDLNADLAQTYADTAQQFFKEAIKNIQERAQAAPDPSKPRLFFPNGIEIIQLTFKVGTQVDISFTIAGEKAPKIHELVIERTVDGGMVSSG
ncbi:MAG TPA: hypothetical protein VKF40_30590 [Burkholderiales bacterium]|nr:hypothetical protein [Burkholderiales bacterium]